jgi:serine O-acetyltransferase
MDRPPIQVDRTSRLVVRLVGWQAVPLAGRLITWLLRLRGVDIPAGCLTGTGICLPHGGFGVVLDASTRVGDRVVIFQGVTIGQARPWTGERPGGVIVEDDVIVSAGAAILASAGGLRLARGSVVGANAVLTSSTRPWEIWAGVPARRIGHRSPTGPGPVPSAPPWPAG